MSNARGVGFSPPSDAISQFKVQTNAFDAQTGHTAGAVVNLALKSGTNSLRSMTGYFNRDDSRSETPLLTIRNGGTKPTRRVQPVHPDGERSDHQGQDVLHGVLRAPEGRPAGAGDLHRADGEDARRATSPSSRRRSSTRAPRPARTPPARRSPTTSFRRTASIPSRRPTRRSIRSPTGRGRTATSSRTAFGPTTTTSFTSRFDHNLGPNNRLFGSGYYNKRQEDRYNWAQDAPNAPGGVINGFAVTQGFDYRSNVGVTVGYTRVHSLTTVFDVRGSCRASASTAIRRRRSIRPSSDSRPPRCGLMKGYQYLPFITLGSFSTTNAGLDDRVARLDALRLERGLQPPDDRRRRSRRR